MWCIIDPAIPSWFSRYRRLSRHTNERLSASGRLGRCYILYSVPFTDPDPASLSSLPLDARGTAIDVGVWYKRARAPCRCSRCVHLPSPCFATMDDSGPTQLSDPRRIGFPTSPGGASAPPTSPRPVCDSDQPRVSARALIYLNPFPAHPAPMATYLSVSSLFVPRDWSICGSL